MKILLAIALSLVFVASAFAEVSYIIVDRDNIRRIETNEVSRDLSYEELERENLEAEGDINTYNAEITAVQARIDENNEMIRLLGVERERLGGL